MTGNIGDVTHLEQTLRKQQQAGDRDGWALTAYRLGVARSELATNVADLDAAVALLEGASRVLTAERAPVEHSRILTATAHCRRAAGARAQALELFELACALVRTRVPSSELAAALVNVGLARCEVGYPEAALDPLSEAIARLGEDAASDNERLASSAYLNRAQAHQAIGTGDSLEAALADYRSALAIAPPASPQEGLAAHGLGTAYLELHERLGVTSDHIELAIEAFSRALGIFTLGAFPFQHAVAKHSLSVAYAGRGASGDVGRALLAAEAALAVFDPRLHSTQWKASADALVRYETAFDAQQAEVLSGTRDRHDRMVATLLCVDATERTSHLRERLVRCAAGPEVRLRAEMSALVAAFARRCPAELLDLLGSFIGVLMELPDEVLDAACVEMARASETGTGAATFARTIDEVIHETLFGPQRVRVRDLLGAHGWVRP